MKRILNGCTYNTDTAISVHENKLEIDPQDPSEMSSREVLYKNRYGAYFLYNSYSFLNGTRIMDGEEISPIEDNEAQLWLEKYVGDEDLKINLIQLHFGEPDEAGQPDRRLTLRMPSSLKQEIDELSKKAGLSVNSWIVSALNKQVQADKNPALQTAFQKNSESNGNTDEYLEDLAEICGYDSSLGVSAESWIDSQLPDK